MTDGPRAALAEVIINTLSRDRTRTTLLHDPRYYAIRNHVMGFLLERSRTFDRNATGYDPGHPPEVRPGENGKPSAIADAKQNIVRFKRPVVF